MVFNLTSKSSFLFSYEANKLIPAALQDSNIAILMKTLGETLSHISRDFLKQNKTKCNLRFPRFSLFGLRMSKMTVASLRIRPSFGEIITILCQSRPERQPHQSLCVYFTVASPQLRSKDMNKFKSGRRSSEPYNSRTRVRLANCESSGNNVKFGKFSSL